MKKSELKQLIKEIIEEIQNPFKVGDEVKLKLDVLGRHARSVPAHMGYSREQFAWRDALNKLEGKVGKIERLFPNSKHVNVDFDGHLIGIDYTELDPVNITEDKLSYPDQIKRAYNKAKKEKNIEAMAYYSFLPGDTSASVSFDRFKNSWAYTQWVKKPEVIQRMKKFQDEMKRFNA